MQVVQARVDVRRLNDLHIQFSKQFRGLPGNGVGETFCGAIKREKEFAAACLIASIFAKLFPSSARGRWFSLAARPSNPVSWCLTDSGSYRRMIDFAVDGEKD